MCVVIFSCHSGGTNQPSLAPMIFPRGLRERVYCSNRLEEPIWRSADLDQVLLNVSLLCVLSLRVYLYIVIFIANQWVKVPVWRGPCLTLRSWRFVLLSTGSFFKFLGLKFDSIGQVIFYCLYQVCFSLHFATDLISPNTSDESKSIRNSGKTRKSHEPRFQESSSNSALCL